MSVPIVSQIEFYNWQLRELDLEWAKYHGSAILDLYAANSLYIGKVWGFDDKRGILILRFKKRKFPRLNIPLTLSYPKSSAGLVKSWSFTYGQYRELYAEQYTDCSPVFYLENKVNEEYRYVGVKNVSTDFLRHIKNDLEQGIKSVIVLGEVDPPREYLVALRKFTETYPENPILNISSRSMQNWRPKPLNDENTIINDSIKIINKNDTTVIQGPPGTGKTYLIANLCNHYLGLNKKICVVALTNKALIEVALKKGLKERIKDRRVFKTNVTADEESKIPQLNNHDIFQPIPHGSLLLATYYVFSKLILELPLREKSFDLLIIEEASQAYLTTIAGFRELGLKILVVGDFMQLQPIVRNSKNSYKIDKNISTIINGLRSFSVNQNQNSYRLLNSYRLSDKSASQTGIFYDNQLLSLSEINNGINVESYDSIFCPFGGTSIVNFNGMNEGRSPHNAIKFILELVVLIKRNNPKLHIAILSPYKITVNTIVDEILYQNIGFKNIEVNTVDRIQGMTVDICIFLTPSLKPSFVMEENRFNVATSRAKKGTLIVMEKSVALMPLLTDKVSRYINSCHVFEYNKNLT
jgi:hypothetical protein